MHSHMRRWFQFFIIAFAIVVIDARVYAQPTFNAIGTLNNPSGYMSSECLGVSADGSTVVGTSIISGHPVFGGTYAAFRWTESTGIVNIYSLGGIGTICHAYGADATGETVVGMANYGVLTPTQIVAFVWTEEIGTVEIGDLPGGPSGSARAAARGISADATIIAGQGESDSGAEGFRFTAVDSVFLGIGDLAGGTFASEGLGVSADGTTIVGRSSSTDGHQAIRWTFGSGIEGLGFLPTNPGVEPFSVANATNADGSVIVGLSRSLASGQGGWEAFRWTQAGGMVNLGDLTGGQPNDPILAVAHATSADGSIVVGTGGVLGNCTPFGCQTAPRAFIWDAPNGMRDLNVVLPGLGLNLGGWVLQEARGISANGRVIVGTGTNPQGVIMAWRVDLGPLPTTLGDMNCDGNVNFADVGPFSLALTDPSAYELAFPLCDIDNGDINADSNEDGLDVQGFVQLLTGP